VSLGRIGGRRSASRSGQDRLVVDLREQLRVISEPPPLPAQWRLEVAHATADGAAFGGDFCVPVRTGDRLQLLLADVSGKGLDAGIRALLLAAAVSGILGAVAPADVLPALDAHLIRQAWEDGFGTAVHVSIDLTDGSYRLALAGHPPPAHFHAGSGEWRLVEAAGPVLGLGEPASWEPATGRLDPGDALLLYTDGCVERSREDIDTGIDRLLGAAYRHVLAGFDGAATRLIATNLGSPDDRAVALLWRGTNPS
jgi:serine phosphatase RsbU (regulator of sigma subunit)